MCNPEGRPVGHLTGKIGSQMNKVESHNRALRKLRMGMRGNPGKNGGGELTYILVLMGKFDKHVKEKS